MCGRRPRIGEERLQRLDEPQLLRLSLAPFRWPSSRSTAHRRSKAQNREAHAAPCRATMYTFVETLQSRCN